MSDEFPEVNMTMTPYLEWCSRYFLEYQKPIGEWSKVAKWNLSNAIS